MNTMNFTRNLMLSVAAIASSAALMAQNDQKLSAHIPFAFQMKGATMPAGKYEVSLVRTSGGVPSFIRFRNVETNRSAVTVVHNGGNAKATTPEISFRCAKDTCAAAGIHAGNGTIYSLPARMPEGTDDSKIVLTKVRLQYAGL